jgi:hypothetical protein
MDVAIILDVSGSMGAAASSPGTESSGLTVLDVAKHGVATVIHTLRPEDTLSLVTFNQNGTVLLDATPMDENGKKSADACLSRVCPGGGTNISNGLLQGFATLQTSSKGRFAHMMLLTDGETDEGSAGVRRTLDAYLLQHEKLPCTVSAFGFGSAACTPVLRGIARRGSGSYSYIPDAGFVGTVFVNALANLLCTAGIDVVLSVEPVDGHEIVEVLGGLQEVTTTSGSFKRLPLGTLQAGQTRDVVLLMKSSSKEALLTSPLFATATYREPGVSCGCEMSFVWSEEADVIVSQQVDRALLVDRLNSVALALGDSPSGTDLERSASELRALSQRLSASPSASTRETRALLEDLEGQCLTAVARADYWRTWGKHYYPSLAFAHMMQQCNNFKDPGVQVYGGDLFKDVQDRADDVFNTLPPPAPSGRGAATQRAPVNMQAFNDRNGGCVHGLSKADMLWGESRRVSELKKGDLLKGLDGETAEVLCVVETPGGAAVKMVAMSDALLLTPHHPVRKGDDAWAFPADVGESIDLEADRLYSFVVHGSTAVSFGGIAVVALGHGIAEGVAAHPYFGTSRVLRDLEKAPGFANGRVSLASGWDLRHPETGLVEGSSALE